MIQRSVTIGLVGVANHGTTILNAILAAENLRLISCYDVDRNASQRVQQQHGIRVASSYDDLVADPQLDAVALVTPNHLHAEQVTKAAEAGKHIFVEKPISNSIAEAKQMIAEVNKKGLVFMVGHNTRRRQVFRRAKKILQEGRLGKVVAVEANVSRPAGLEPGLPAWKADPAKCPLLPMTQLGIHFVDTIAYLIGYVERVSCIAANIAMPGNVYDSTAAVLQLENGVPVALTSCYVTPDAYFLRVYCTAGILHCYPTRLRLELSEYGKPMELIEEDFSQEGGASFNEEMKEFGECVLTKRKPETDGEGGLRALAVVEAMAQSVAKSTVINIRDMVK